MLELVSGEFEEQLLKRSSLSYEKIYNLENKSKRSLELCIGNIQDQEINQDLIDELKKHQEFSIWYSSLNTEELNNYYYLINQISTNIPNSTIYVIDTTKYKKEIFSLLSCKEEEIENLLKYQQKLTLEDIKEATDYWNNLVQENADLRIIENNKLVSLPYSKVEVEILTRLAKYKEIDLQEFIGTELLATNLFYIRNGKTWEYLINNLINQNKIKTLRTETKLNSLGYKMTTNILSIVK